MRMYYQKIRRHTFMIVVILSIIGSGYTKPTTAEAQNILKSGKTIKIGERMFHVVRESASEEQDVLKLLIEGFPKEFVNSLTSTLEMYQD